MTSRDILKADASLHQYRLDVLHLRAGDQLIVRVPGYSHLMGSKIGRERAKMFKRRFTTMVPHGVKVLIVDEEEKLQWIPKSMGSMKWKSG